MILKRCLLALALSTTVFAHPQQPAAGSPPGPDAGLPTYKPTNSFPWKNMYPVPRAVPQPKPEWMELLKNATIANAPVVKKAPDGSLVNPNPPGQDPYCAWSFTGCKRPDDIFTCQKGHWALTYDDGPTLASPPLYDVLDKMPEKVTFFVIGGQVIQYPEMLQRIYKAGHEIGIHTWSHNLLTSQTTEQIVAELKWTELAIKEVIGVAPRFMRPPYGDMDDRVRGIVKQLGFIPVIWNHDTFDWKINTPGFDASSIEAAARQWAGNASTAAEGGISLQHDQSQQTVDMAIKVLPIIKGAYKLSTVGQCVNFSPAQVYKEDSSKPAGQKVENKQSGANGFMTATGALTWVTIISLFVVSFL